METTHKQQDQEPGRDLGLISSDETMMSKVELRVRASQLMLYTTETLKQHIKHHEPITTERLELGVKCQRGCSNKLVLVDNFNNFSKFM